MADSASSRRLLAMYVLVFLAITAVQCQQRFGDKPRTLHADYPGAHWKSMVIDRISDDTFERQKRDVAPSTTPIPHVNNPNVTAKVGQKYFF